MVQPDLCSEYFIATVTVVQSHLGQITGQQPKRVKMGNSQYTEDLQWGMWNTELGADV